MSDYKTSIPALNFDVLGTEMRTAFGDAITGISSVDDPKTPEVEIIVHFVETPTSAQLATVETIILAHDPTAKSQRQQAREAALAKREAVLARAIDPANMNVRDLAQTVKDLIDVIKAGV